MVGAAFATTVNAGEIAIAVAAAPTERIALRRVIEKMLLVMSKSAIPVREVQATICSSDAGIVPWDRWGNNCINSSHSIAKFAIIMAGLQAALFG